MEFYTLFERLSRLQTKDKKTQKMSIIRFMGLSFPLLSNFLSEKNLLKN